MGKKGEKKMKAYRKGCTCLLLALSIALICLLGVGPDPVHAATITVDTVTDENDGSCAHGDCSLRDAIQIAAPDDTIVFAAALSGQTIVLTIGQLDIDKGLTIDGSSLASHVRISGATMFRVFVTHSSDTVTLRDLDIISGSVSDGNGGSGIYNQRYLTVIGCAISGNTTPNNGGGIRNTGTLSIIDSLVSGNTAGYGGGIRNEGDLTAIDSTVSDNTADFGGGIDNYVGSMTLSNVTLESNVANHYGGGMTTGATAIIEESIFRDNSAERGGGVDSHETGITLTLTRCTFTGNTSYWDGGALLNDGATVEVNDSAFESNSAGESGGGSGGAIFNTAMMTLTGCRLNNNAAPTEGGGIFNEKAGTLTINGGALTGNTAAGEGSGWGGGISNYGDLTLHGAVLSGNTAHLHGGGIWNWDGQVTVEGATLTANSAEDNGGAIVNNSSESPAVPGSLTVFSSTFDSNSADSGGAILNDNNSTVTLENSTLSANSAVYDGGGIFNVSGTVTIANGTLYSNAAGSGGGINNRGTLNYRNTLIGGSPSSGDCVNNGTLGDNIANLVQDGSCPAASGGDPGLGPLQDNGGPTKTHALLPDSPALEAGDGATCLSADQRGATRPADGDADGAAACDIGAFESGDMQCGIQAAGSSADYLFPGNVNLRVTDDGDYLDCLRVTAIPSAHANAAVALKTGNYWRIDALAADRSTAAIADYTVDLTLPDDTADPDSRVCRYTGDGWDCAVTSYDASTSVTRADISDLSDWAVSSGDCAAAAMPEPGISLTGSQKREVRLSWAADPANAGGYQVHRSTSPYFMPGAGTLLTTRPPGSTSYTDAGAAGTAGVSYSYIVRGLGNCGTPSDYGTRLGVFVFGLVPGS